MQTENHNEHGQDDAAQMAKAARRELDDAKARLGEAADRVRHEARNAGSTISSLILDEMDRRAADMGTQFQSVADRLRGGEGDDGADASRGMSAHAADLIEDVSSRLQGQSMRDIGQRIGQFGRENPALFVMGCLLTGAMAGRMIVASDEASAPRDGGRQSNRTARSEPFGKVQSRAEQTATDWQSQRPGAAAFGGTPAGAGFVQGGRSNSDGSGFGSATTTDGSDGTTQGGPGSGRND